ncbi:MAG TPA: hypothetical protein VEY11_08240 [Pyrinomonadaceae bacterium]|nr:hypothetical protein [Pyrinomonadaceae bacterium]
MSARIEERQLRVYCPTHKINFETPETRRILCESGGHALAHDFPREDFWEYCCDCQVFWPSDMDKGGRAKEHCLVCARVTTRRYVCDECKLISLESDDPAKRKTFRITSRGAVEPSCPGCRKLPKATLQEHICEDSAATFRTARASCPFCDDPIRKEAGILCPHCGKEAKAGYKFCKHCGQNVDLTVSTSHTQASPLEPRQVVPLPSIPAAPTLANSSPLPHVDYIPMDVAAADADALPDPMPTITPAGGHNSAKMKWIVGAVAILGLIITIAMLNSSTSTSNNFTPKFNSALAAGRIFQPPGDCVADLYEAEASRSPNSSELREASAKIRSKLEPEGNDAFQRYYAESDQTIDWEYITKVYNLLQKTAPSDKEFSARYAYSVALTSLKRKDYTKALSSYQDALRYHPDWALAFNGLGRVYLQEDWSSRDEDKTVEYYRKACEVDSAFIWGCKNLGEFYSRKGNWALAEDYMTRALQRAPTRESIVRAMGRICPKVGKYQTSSGTCGTY